MALNMEIKSGDKTILLRLTSNDIDVFNYLAKNNYKREVEVVLGANGFGEYKTINKSEYEESVNKLLDCVLTKPDEMPYEYSLRSEIILKNGSRVPGSGSGISGFKIKGELYRLEAGLGVCILHKIMQDENGEWMACEHKDVRNEEIIHTDGEFATNYKISDITIQKKKASTKIKIHLNEMQEFLSKINAESIQKRIG